MNGWRSSKVGLVALGTGGALVLGGCSSGSHHRNVYRSMQDCAADYSQSTCSQKGEQSAGRFLGPVYRMVSGRPRACSSQDPGGGPFVGSRKTAVERAGFGYSCRSRSSSGRSFFSGG